MKKIILSAVMFTMISTTQIFGQAKAKELPVPNVSFCGATKDNDIVKFSDLGKCDELIQPYKELKIKSFNLSFQLPPAKGEKEGMFVDYSNNGSKLSKENLDILKTLEAKKVTKLLIEKVVVLEADGKSERKMAGIVINLK